MTPPARKIAVTISVLFGFMAILITSASSAENMMQQLAAVQARERAMQLSVDQARQARMAQLSAETAARVRASAAIAAAHQSIEQSPIVNQEPSTSSGRSFMVLGPAEAVRGKIDKGGPGRGGR